MNKKIKTLSAALSYLLVANALGDKINEIDDYNKYKENKEELLACPNKDIENFPDHCSHMSHYSHYSGAKTNTDKKR